MLGAGAWGCAFGFWARVICFDRPNHNPNFFSPPARRWSRLDMRAPATSSLMLGIFALAATATPFLVHGKKIVWLSAAECGVHAARTGGTAANACAGACLRVPPVLLDFLPTLSPPAQERAAGSKCWTASLVPRSPGSSTTRTPHGCWTTGHTVCLGELGLQWVLHSLHSGRRDLGRHGGAEYRTFDKFRYLASSGKFRLSSGTRNEPSSGSVPVPPKSTRSC